MDLRPLAALPLLLALSGCGAATAHPAAAHRATARPASTHSTTSTLRLGATAAPTVPPDLAGHQYDRPDADRVLVAGDTADLVLPTGRVRLTVNGPVPALQKVMVGPRHTYLLTFRVTATVLSGAVDLRPERFSLLAIADQVDGAARVTTTALSSTLAAGATRTWTASFVEGHGEYLFTPAGTTRPAALWDFRVEA